MNYELLPIITFNELWHVGTLNPADKGIRGLSYEGGGLSVSKHPESWIRIAKLGGQPTWRVTKADGTPGRFVNWWSLSSDLQGIVAKHAEAAGYLCVEPRFEVTWFDLEDDTHNFTTYKTRQEAEEECESLKSESHIDFPAITEIQKYVATPQLVAAVGSTVTDQDSIAVALSVLLETVAELDGIWWNERHDVASLRAPRGMLTRAALANWSFKNSASPA